MLKKIPYAATIGLAMVILLSIGCNSEPETSAEPTLVVLSLDGFRWDYAAHTHTPNLDKIATVGVRAESLIPVFPTGTFANHYSMATGLYPDHHGIVANRFTCPIFGEDFNKSDRSTVRDGKFYGGEPIWNTAENQGLKSAAFFWVGSEADVQETRPDRWKIYNNSTPYGDRIDTVIHWLSLAPEKRPHLIMWYYHQVDSDGHRYGPLADSLLRTVSLKDSLIGVFLDKMEKLPRSDQINFIVVSDHGMAELPSKQIVPLDQYIDTAHIEIFDGGLTTANIRAKSGQLDELYESLSRVPNLSVWKSGEVPEHFNYGNHPRTHDLVILADMGWGMGWSWRNYNLKAAHGYDNRHTDMHGIFYAMGPDFKAKYTAPAFENIHLYPLMAHLLKVEPADTDADYNKVENMLITNK